MPHRGGCGLVAARKLEVTNHYGAIQNEKKRQVDKAKTKKKKKKKNRIKGSGGDPYGTNDGYVHAGHGSAMDHAEATACSVCPRRLGRTPGPQRSSRLDGGVESGTASAASHVEAHAADVAGGRGGAHAGAGADAGGGAAGQA